MKPPISRQEAERLVNTYADLILRLSYTYLKETQDAQDICRPSFSSSWKNPGPSSPRSTKRPG